MQTRRSLLIGLNSLILANFLTSCQRNNHKLKFSLLNNSIPPQLLAKFHKSFSSEDLILFQLKDKLQEIWESLANKQGNLVTLGDTWLQKSIQNKLIQPLAIEELTGWKKLPQKYQELVRRNDQGYVSEEGKIWGAPYRWGTTMIVYRQDKFAKLKWSPEDWSDLWREEVRDRLSLPANIREVVGLTLKKLGYSYNTKDLAAVPELEKQLKQLDQQVKFYSSDHYLQPLVMGDTWVAVGWSTDIIPLTKAYSNIKAVVPKSGTSIWVDLWVKAAYTQESDLIQQWIDFCWETQSAESITRLTNAASPIILNQDLDVNHLVAIDTDIFNKSEFLLPLYPETLEQYQSLWKRVIS